MAQNSVLQRILQVQAAFEGALLAKKNVIGVAVGFKESGGLVTDQLAVIALVNEKRSEGSLSPSDVVPKQVDGIRTDVYEVGELRALSQPRDRVRPIQAGVSAGHFRITAGTLGVMVRDRTTGDLLLLSNNHVFANNNEAQVGDAVLQPAALDGGQLPADMVARVERFVPLRFIEDAVEEPPPATPTQPPPQPKPIERPPTTPPSPNELSGCSPIGMAVTALNALASATGSAQRVTTASAASAQSAAPVSAAVTPLVVAQAVTPDNALDAALARPLNQQMFNNSILNVGAVTGTKPAALGMRIRKMGRTTGLTTGTVTLLNATISIGYSTSRGERTARFTGQVLTTSMSQGGDSGSLIVDEFENRAIGLLFAGSGQASVFTPIDIVLAALNVML